MGEILKRAGAIIPLATILGYVYSYSFEFGYATFFGYPRSYISFSLGMITNISLQGLFGVMVVIGFLQLALQSWPFSKRHVILAALFSTLIYFIVVIAASFIPMFMTVGILLAPALVYIGMVISPWASEPAADGADNDPTPSFYDARHVVRSGSIADRIIRGLGFDPLLMFILFLLLPSGLFYINGMIEAHTKKTFYLYEYQGKSYAIIREYGKSFVSVRYNEPLEIRLEYSIIPQDRAEGVRRRTLEGVSFIDR